LEKKSVLAWQAAELDVFYVSRKGAKAQKREDELRKRW
jgi:hypothetical protein